MIRFLLTLGMCWMMNLNCVFGQNAFLSFPDRSEFRNILLSSDSLAPVAVSLRSSKVPVPDQKKPMLGALFSAAVPGAGECYAGSWLKGSLFFAAEVALWVGYSHYSNKGQTWDDTFTDFANEHWSEPGYWVYMAGPGQANIPGVDMNNYMQYLEKLRDYEKERFSHSLHVEKDQQYYEMIGKYDQFHAGWDDFDGNKPDLTLTPHRDEYDEMRYKSNMAFKNASACVMGVLLNHVLSAFDAGWTIKSANKKLHASFRTGWNPDAYGGMPVFSFETAW
jgi:hypothetical protein